MLSHDRFDAALTRFCTEVPALYDGDWASSRALVEARRYGLAVLIAHLNGPGAERATTKMQMVALCERKGLALRRSVEGAIDTLVAAGFVRMGDVAGDRRARAPLPTERLLAHFRRSLACRLGCVGEVLPLPEPSAALAARREAVPALLRADVELLFARHVKLHDDVPAVRFFTERLMGFFVMLELLRRGSVAGADGPFAFQTTGLAERLCVSRSHLENMLRAAADAGIVRIEGRRRLALPLATLRTLRTAVAIELAWTARHQGLAMTGPDGNASTE